MAIQNRRGPYQDFDPTKMVEGEFAFVLSDDPAGVDGQSVYASFQNGSAKRLATYEDMEDNIDQATTSIQQDLTQGVNTAISDAQSAVRTMQSDIADTISDAETAVDGLESDVASAITQAQTDIGTIQSDYQALKSDNSNQLYNMQTSVNTAIDNIQGSASQAVAAADYAIEQADAVRQILEEGAVASFNGRTGAVVPQTNDYTSAQISHGTGSVFDALASKQNTLIQGQGINITNNVISADISSIEIPDPHDVIYGGTITAQGQGILAAIGSAHNAIEITAGAVFDVQYPLLYAPDEIENLTTGTGDTLGIYAIYGTATTPSDITSPVAYAPIYIVGTVSGTSFTVDSTTPYTQTLPNSEDGKVYMLVGNTGNSGSSYVFSPSEKLFAYKGSAISVVTPYDLILKGVTDNIQTLLGNVTLPTTAQTVTGAIDELNSNKVSTSGDTMTGNLNMANGALVDGVDVSTLAMQTYDSGAQNLNDFKSRGLYYFGTGCTLTNVPNSAVNGWLTVIDSGGGVCKQYWHRHGSIPTTFKDEYFRYYNSSAWSDWIRVGLYDDIGIIHLGVISISGQLSAVGSWIKSNFIANRWISARVSNVTASGYFGTSGFCINANLSSQNYGFGWLQSDGANMILFFRLSAGTFYWWHPTMTQVTG